MNVLVVQVLSWIGNWLRSWNEALTIQGNEGVG